MDISANRTDKVGGGGHLSVEVVVNLQKWKIRPSRSLPVDIETGKKTKGRRLRCDQSLMPCNEMH